MIRTKKRGNKMKYKDKGVRDLCHGVKERNQRAIEEMAEYFINLEIINADSILIPAPQHEGYAIYTKQIAEIVAKETKAKIYDILKCKPHEMLYKQKQKGKVMIPEIYLIEQLIDKENIYFLDNVIDTGTTFNTANILFNGKLKPLVYAIV